MLILQSPIDDMVYLKTSQCFNRMGYTKVNFLELPCSLIDNTPLPLSTSCKLPKSTVPWWYFLKAVTKAQKNLGWKMAHGGGGGGGRVDNKQA